jgi:hypothetical protein
MDIDLVKRRVAAFSFIVYPLFAGFAFAAHPNIASLTIGTSAAARIAEFHGNGLMHFGHFLMGLAVLPLIVIALHLSRRLERRAPWTALIGVGLAIAGAVVRAMDKAALCYVPSAFDTLGEAEFGNLAPGIEAMFGYRGYLGLLHFLPMLPIGFVVLGAGLVRTQVIDRKHAIPMLAGAILMLNPDIDIIGLAATTTMALGFVPYAIRLMDVSKD